MSVDAVPRRVQATEHGASGNAGRKRRSRPARLFLHACLLIISAAWLVPLLWAVYTSLRPYAETARKGYVSWPDTLTLNNYRNALDQGDLGRFFVNTIVIVIPALIVTLALASTAAFVLSKFSFRFNLFFLLVFTAGNLLPPQVIITPLAFLYRDISLPQ